MERWRDSWGNVGDDRARSAVRAALDAGIDFLDTADVYGDGRNERHIKHVLEGREAYDEVTVATKSGRRLDPHVAEDYDYEHIADFIDRSRENLGMDRLDLLQLHCPPTDVCYTPETFDALNRLAEEDRIAHYGVSSNAPRRH